MNRYIDADAALKRFEEMHGNESDLLNCYNADWIVSFIETQPTADVEEVKHAKWVHYGEDVQCSNCGHVSDDICFEGDMDSGYYTVLPHYCSNCGAKMDLEDK